MIYNVFGGTLNLAQSVVVLYLVKRFLFDDDGCTTRGIPSDVSPVVEAYEHAVLARHPRPRYMVGKGTSVMALVATLPDSIVDWLMTILQL